MDIKHIACQCAKSSANGGAGALTKATAISVVASLIASIVTGGLASKS